MRIKIFRIALTWVCVYPIVTLLIFTITSLDFQLPLWQQTFAITIILVPVMVLIITPKISVMINRVAHK